MVAPAANTIPQYIRARTPRTKPVTAKTGYLKIRNQRF